MRRSDRHPGDTLREIRFEEDSVLEVDEIREVGGPSLFSGPWRAVEIWTQNRVYGVAATMRCTEVLDRASGSLQLDHPILGSSLLGGQRRGADGSIRSVCVPYPEPGTVAVFSVRVGGRLKISETSTVTRVVLRQHRVDLPQATTEAPWESLAGAYAREPIG